AVSQLRHILGVSGGGSALPRMLASLAESIGDLNIPTLILGGAATAFLFWVRKGLKPLLEQIGLSRGAVSILSRAGPVLAIAATTRATAMFGLTDQGVAIVGTVPQGVPPLTLPAFAPDLIGALLLPAVLISVIGFVESISVAQTLAARKRQRIDPDQE